MSYKHKNIDSGKILKKLAVCGLVGLSVAAGKVALNEPRHAEKVELAPGQNVPVPSTTKGNVTYAVAVAAALSAAAVARKGKSDQDMERDAKIVDGVVKSSRQNDVEMEVYAPNQGKDGVHKLSAFELAQMRNAGNTK